MKRSLKKLFTTMIIVVILLMSSLILADEEHPDPRVSKYATLNSDVIIEEIIIE